VSKMASNAVLTKTRAMFGQRLTEQNYRELLALGTVPEVADYLKSRTHYASILTDVRDMAMNRRNLEHLLRGKLLRDLADLAQFERNVGEHFFEFIMLQGEIDQVLAFIRCYNAGRPEEYLFDAPDFFHLHSGLDLTALAQARTYDHFLEACGSAWAAPILKQFRPEDGQPVRYDAVEFELDKQLYQRFFQVVKDTFPKESADEVRDILCLHIELDNLRKIYRAKKYYGASADTLRGQLFPYYFHLSKQKLDAIADAASADEVLRMIGETAYGRYYDRKAFTYIDDYAMRVMFDICRKKLHLSSQPAAVVYSAVTLFQIEIDDIVNIIEGIRYQLKPEKIGEMMIMRTN